MRKDGSIGLTLLVSGVLATMTLSWPEAILVFRQADGIGPLLGGPLLALAGAGLYGLLVGAGAWLGAWLLVPGGPRRVVALASNWLDRIAFDSLSPDAARRLLAVQFAAIPALGVALGVWFLGALRFIEKLHNEKLMALGGMLIGCGVLATGALAAWVAYRVLRWALERLRLPGSDWPLVILLVPSLLTTTAVLSVGGFYVVKLAAVVNLEWLPQLGVLLTAGMGFTFAGAAFLRRIPRIPSLLLVLSAPLLFGLLGNVAATRRPVQAGGTLARLTLSLAAGYTDLDGDGFGSLFGGTDCGPWDPAINPAAREIPGNGIDENCNGADGEDLISAQVKGTETLRKKVKKLFRKKPNILLVTWDATRGDRMSYAGHRTPTTPNLDELAEDSAVFLQAYSAGPNTHSSVPALLTGKNIFSVGLEKDKKSRMLIILDDEANVTIAELLKKQGYRTAAVVSHRFFNKQNQWSQGFDKYSVAVRSKSKTVSSPRILRKAKMMIQSHQQNHPHEPLFLWTHFYDPHASYIAHKGTPFATETLPQKYDSELWYTDKHTGELVDEMATLDRPTIIIFTSDHGDELGEHGEYGQHRTLHRENTHVPMLIHVPGLKAQRVMESVSTTDILPTIADLVGAKIPDGVRGVSLLPGLFRGSMEGRGPVFSEVAWRFEKPPEHWISVTLGNARLLKEMRSGRHQLFFTDVDPAEHYDQAGQGHTEEAELLDYLSRFLETTTIPTQKTGRIP